MSESKTLGPVKGCMCYGANTPDLEGRCPCQGIDLRSPAGTDLDRHQKAVDMVAKAAATARAVAADGVDPTAEIHHLETIARERLQEARREIGRLTARLREIQNGTLSARRALPDAGRGHQPDA